MFEINIQFTDSFYNKTNPENYTEALSEMLKFLGDELVTVCQDESPVRTGRLREGHYSVVDGLNVSVNNNVEYAKYVIYGTSRQAPNNYPSRAISRMNIDGEGKSIFEQSLITRGVL